MLIELRKFFESIFENLGLVMAPITAAVMTGLSIQHYFADLIGRIPSMIIGFVFAFAIEATGYMSFVAYQKDKDIKKPVGYLVSVLIVVTIIELFVFSDWQRWCIGLSGVAIAGVMYWSYSASNAKTSQLEDDIEENERLSKAGMYRARDGSIKVRKSTAKMTATSTANGAQKLRKNSIPPEVKPDVMQLTFSEFSKKYAGQYAVKERSYYNWQKELRATAVLTG